MIFSIAEMAASREVNSNFIIRPDGLRFRPLVPYFWALPEDSGKESNEKYRVIAPCVVGSDLLDHKRTEHAFASRVRVRDQQQNQFPDDCPQARALIFQFLMERDRV